MNITTSQLIYNKKDVGKWITGFILGLVWTGLTLFPISQLLFILSALLGGIFRPLWYLLGPLEIAAFFLPLALLKLRLRNFQSPFAKGLATETLLIGLVAAYLTFRPGYFAGII